MQTPGERALLNAMNDACAASSEQPCRILNIGAGKSDVVESFLEQNGQHVLSDRLDIEDARIAHPFARTIYRASVEEMTHVQNGQYDAACANYLFEHVNRIPDAAREVYRVLKPGGILAISVPNPRALEFWVSRRTPLWFHRFVRGGTGWETAYTYGSIGELTALFEQAGFATVQVMQTSFVFGYLGSKPVLGKLARIYDWLVNHSTIKSLQGNACLVFQKPQTPARGKT